MENKSKKYVILLHGAFADASAWRKVIPLLEKEELTVTAVQLALNSLADDVTTTKRVVDSLAGDVILVGHSYGGAVITEAAAGNPNIKALVYIAAFAPDAGETLSVLVEKFPHPPVIAATVRDSAGYVYIDRDKLHSVYAHDLSMEEASLIAATQKPLNSTIIAAEPIKAAAWKNIPSWYVISTEDKTINPDLQRFMAKRIGAKTHEIKSSHVSHISNASEVAKVIKTAAASID
jgi:pimeloyl-ACP methyl ester carboxylesterase